MVRNHLSLPINFLFQQGKRETTLGYIIMLIKYELEIYMCTYNKNRS